MDKRELKRQYKETPTAAGVYRVWNKKDDRALVGASINAPAMLNRQRAQLKMGLHPNPELQNDWNVLGEEAFAFEVLDTLTPLEELWLERLAPYGARGYNRPPLSR